MLRKWICLSLALCLTISLSIPAGATGSVEEYAESLLQYYRHYREKSEDIVWDILNKMRVIDPNQAAVWEKIMGQWAWVNEEMPVVQDVLPDGLPEDDSLCILVLGYALNANGTMREELVDRLVVALASAMKYPNALIALSGGKTSSARVTEAEVMAQWLIQRGVEPERIIQDHKSYDTTANMRNVYQLLNEGYHQVDTVAIVTTDYHARWAGALFAVLSAYSFGYEAGNPIDLVCVAVNESERRLDPLSYQARGISEITGVAYSERYAAPPYYEVERPPEPETVPTEAISTEEVQQAAEPDPEETSPVPDSPEVVSEPEEKRGTPAALYVMVASLAALVALLTPRKPKKKRQRPQWNWD